MSMTVRLSSWPGPFMAFSRLTRPQPITASGAAWREPSSLVAVVSSTCSACSLVMYGKRSMMTPRAPVACGAAIEVPV
ncbi:hypothetical protein D3C87_887180 [compost metagenome]